MTYGKLESNPGVFGSPHYADDPKSGELGYINQLIGVGGHDLSYLGNCMIIEVFPLIIFPFGWFSLIFDWVEHEGSERIQGRLHKVYAAHATGQTGTIAMKGEETVATVVSG